MTNEASALLDTDAHNKAMDADAALQELDPTHRPGICPATLTVWTMTPRRRRKTPRGREGHSGRDFTCMAESVNAVEAWLGSLPGHAMPTCDSRGLHAQSRAHDPIVCGLGRPRADEHFGAPALSLRERGGDPVSISLHVGDVGHLSCRANGAASRCFLALMVAAVPPLSGKPGLLPSTSRLDRAQRWPWRRLHDLGGACRTRRRARRGPASCSNRRRRGTRWRRNGSQYPGTQTIVITRKQKIISGRPLTSLASALRRRTLTGCRCVAIADLKRGLQPIVWVVPMALA